MEAASGSPLFFTAWPDQGFSSALPKRPDQPSSLHFRGQRRAPGELCAGELGFRSSDGDAAPGGSGSIFDGGGGQSGGHRYGRRLVRSSSWWSLSPNASLYRTPVLAS